MKNYFLDTSFIIDLINKNETALKKHENIKEKEVTGTPCLYELSKFTEQDLTKYFDQNQIMNFTEQDAKTAGELYYMQKKKGKKLPEINTIIAGIVKNRNLTLITRDSDFKKVKEKIDLDIYKT